MIVRYKESSEDSIKSTADLIELLGTRIELYQSHMLQLTQTEYHNTLYQFLLNFDLYIVQTTAKQFALALPLNLNAIITGAVVAISLLVIKELSLMSFKRIFRKRTNPIID